MKTWDIVMPHRLLINRSLRQEAEKLRLHIDQYVQEYENQYQTMADELENARIQCDADFEVVKEEILKKLEEDANMLQSMGEVFLTYINAFFERKIAFKRKDINRLKQKTVKEFIVFLSNQMGEIGDEIDTLQERKHILASRARIDDVIRLVELSGSSISFDGVEDAKELLNRISLKMDTVSEGNTVEWYALLNARTLLEERVEFLAEIKYISWVIDQKIQMSKELKCLRDEQYKMRDLLRTESLGIQTDIDILTKTIQERARSIRFYWAKTIVYSGIELDRSYSRIKECRSELNEVEEDIGRMISSHSSDSFRWDRLQDDKSDLRDEISDLKMRIPFLKEDRNRSYSNRKEVQNLMREWSVPLARIDKHNQSDEEMFVACRLEELALIEKEGKTVAEEKYQAGLEILKREKSSLQEEKDLILSEKKEKLEQVHLQVKQKKGDLIEAKKIASKAIEAEIEKKESEIKKMVHDLNAAKTELKKLYANDKRIIIIRMISEKPEITKGKKTIINLEARKNKTQKEINQKKVILEAQSFPDDPVVVEAVRALEKEQNRALEINEEIQNTECEYDSRLSEYDEKIQALKPEPERPTIEERSEMKKLIAWKEKQKERHEKEGRTDGN